MPCSTSSDSTINNNYYNKNTNNIKNNKKISTTQDNSNEKLNIIKNKSSPINDSNLNINQHKLLTQLPPKSPRKNSFNSTIIEKAQKIGKELEQIIHETKFTEKFNNFIFFKKNNIKNF